MLIFLILTGDTVDITGLNTFGLRYRSPNVTHMSFIGFLNGISADADRRRFQLS